VKTGAPFFPTAFATVSGATTATSSGTTHVRSQCFRSSSIDDSGGKFIQARRCFAGVAVSEGTTANTTAATVRWTTADTIATTVRFI